MDVHRRQPCPQARAGLQHACRLRPLRPIVRMPAALLVSSALQHSPSCAVLFVFEFLRSSDQITPWLNAGAVAVSPVWIEACMREKRLVDLTGELPKLFCCCSSSSPAFPLLC